MQTSLTFTGCLGYRLQEVDVGFVVVIDRRKDKWGSVKTLLLRIAVSG